jgi:hypothetical protein
VFTRSGATWTQQGSKLTGGGESGEGAFGASVALSADGNTALIGAPHDNGYFGAAWAFTRSGSTWAQQGEKRTGGGESGEGAFGYSVALSAAGDTALIGGPYDGLPGAAWVFVASSAPQAPIVTTGNASSVAQTSATLTATVNPEGAEVSDCHFEYGSSEAYGSSVACSTLPGSGASPVAVSAPVTLLSPNTTYHFRISATNLGGTSKGADAPFKTLPNVPAVQTGAASEVKQKSATLNATVNPEGGEVSDCHFEYGPSEAYGSRVACAAPPGSGTTPVAVSAAAVGLTPNTSYHFRIVATNPGGTSYGSDLGFKTPPDAPTVIKVSPNKGHAAGGTNVTITGTNFVSVTAVKFGPNAAPTFTVNSPTSITVVSPPGPRGRVDVTVMTQAGMSAISRKDRFKYAR